MAVPETPFTINPVGEPDLDELLLLVRAYCDFYSVTPTDRDLRAVMLGLLASGGRDGLQLLARDRSGDSAGFATLLFTCWPPPAPCKRQPSSRSPTRPAARAPSPDYPTAPPDSPPSNSNRTSSPPPSEAVLLCHAQRRHGGQTTQVWDAEVTCD